MAGKFLPAIMARHEVAPLLSDGHCSVDGTLVKASALIKASSRKAESTPSDDDDPGGPSATRFVDALYQHRPKTAQDQP